MASNMRAIDIRNGTGPAKSLYINDATPKPTPRPTDAIVRIKAFGLNRMDLLQRMGMYPVPSQAPKTLGVEFSGVVESLSNEAESGFKPGDEVFGLAYGGMLSLCFVSVRISGFEDGQSKRRERMLEEMSTLRAGLLAYSAIHMSMVSRSGKREN